MTASVLVTGGAGYIGSHMVRQLRRAGCRVVVFDDLARGHRDAVGDASLVVGDLCRPGDLEQAFALGPFDAVMHFAALAYVGESVSDPARYWRNNVLGTLALLDAMRRNAVRRMVFSSTCAVYGEPLEQPITEAHPCAPLSPYGRSKLAAEQAIRDHAQAYGLSAIALRYFNAAGCDPGGALGERHVPETHLIPLVLAEALRRRNGGRADETTLEVFGEDFDTPDGTCVRDYVHVDDLCVAHGLALERLLEDRSASFEVFNLGTGTGRSVREVIETCSDVSGVALTWRRAARRPGDPASLVAAAERARRTLGWEPRFLRFADTVATAWRWIAAQPSGER